MPKVFGAAASEASPLLVMPDVLTRGTKLALPPHKPSEPFLYAHYPANWNVVDGELLPALRKFVISVGVNGVDKGGSTQLLQASLMSRGFILLDPKNVNVGNYVVGTKVSRGVRWHNRWEHPQHQFGTELPDEIDNKGYNDWRRNLVTSGVLPPPSAGVLQVMAARMRRRVHTREPRAADSKAGQRQLEAAQDDLDDAMSARAPGAKKAPKAKGSLLTGNASADRDACEASTDIEALQKALVETKHVTVERVIAARLAKLGA